MLSRVPRSDNRISTFQAAAWRAPSRQRFEPTAANDNGERTIARDPTRPSSMIGLVSAGALAVVLIAMIAGEI